MSLMIVIQDLSRGGAQRVVANLFAGLDPSHDAHLVVLTDRIDYEVAPKLGQRVTYISASRILFALPKLAVLICKEQPKVIFSSIFFTDVLVFFLTKLFSPSTRIVFRSCNFFTKTFPDRNAILARLVLYCYRRSKSLICSTETMRQDYLSLCPSLVDKIHVIPNPISLAQIQQMAESKIDHEWLCDPEIFVFICVAKFKPQKNIPLLIEAFSELDGQSHRLILLGQGEQEHELKAMVNRLSMSDRIEFMGFKSNPYALVKKADALILSSDYEGFPNVLIEAMALETSVVSTDCASGPSEIIEHGQSGLLCPPGDKMALRDCMEEIKENKDINKKLASNAFDYVQTFDTKQVVRNFGKVFEEASSNW